MHATPGHLRRPPRPVTTGALVLAAAALTLAGCGGSGSKSQSASAPVTTATTSSQPHTTSDSTQSKSTPSTTATTAPSTTTSRPLSQSETIALTSPALTGGKEIPAQYTCDGEDASLPLAWPTVPPGTQELVVFVIGPQPKSQGKTSAAFSIQWAVAGLSPSLRGLPAGKLPAGALVGLNSFGKRAYTICPEKGPSQNYDFLLFALPTQISVAPNYNGLVLLERLILAGAKTKRALVAHYKRA